MNTIFAELKDSVFRHVVQNAVMGVPAVRMLAKRWHNTGMGRSKDKIVPVLSVIIDMLDRAKTDFRNKVVVELGPGQTPDLLFAALLFGARKAIGLDIQSYLEPDAFYVNRYEETAKWIGESILVGQLPRASVFEENRFGKETIMPDTCFDIIQYDGIHFPLEDRSVDIVWSRSVLEHVKQYKKLIGEIKRVLRPAGVTCHIIDLRDHTTLESGKDWLRFLKYRESLWNLMTSNRTTWSNRLRASQWENLF